MTPALFLVSNCIQYNMTDYIQYNMTPALFFLVFVLVDHSGAKREACLFIARKPWTGKSKETYIHQKRPAYLKRKNYFQESGKRVFSLLENPGPVCQKRPINIKWDLHIWQKRIILSKAASVSFHISKPWTSMSKKTYIYQKRPANSKRENYFKFEKRELRFSMDGFDTRWIPRSFSCCVYMERDVYIWKGMLENKQLDVPMHSSKNEKRTIKETFIYMKRDPQKRRSYI